MIVVLDMVMLAHLSALQGVLQAAQQQVLPCVYICLCHGILARKLQIYMSCPCTNVDWHLHMPDAAYV